MGQRRGVHRGREFVRVQRGEGEEAEIGEVANANADVGAGADADADADAGIDAAGSGKAGEEDDDLDLVPALAPVHTPYPAQEELHHLHSHSTPCVPFPSVGAGADS